MPLKLNTHVGDDGTMVSLDWAGVAGCAIALDGRGDDASQVARVKAQLLDWLIAKINEQERA